MKYWHLFLCGFFTSLISTTHAVEDPGCAQLLAKAHRAGVQIDPESARWISRFDPIRQNLWLEVQSESAPDSRQKLIIQLRSLERQEGIKIIGIQATDITRIQFEITEQEQLEALFSALTPDLSAILRFSTSIVRDRQKETAIQGRYLIPKLKQFPKNGFWTVLFESFLNDPSVRSIQDLREELIRSNFAVSDIRQHADSFLGERIQNLVVYITNPKSGNALADLLQHLLQGPNFSRVRLASQVVFFW